MQEEEKRPPSSQSNKSNRSNRSRKSLRDVLNQVNNPASNSPPPAGAQMEFRSSPSFPTDNNQFQFSNTEAQRGTAGFVNRIVENDAVIEPRDDPLDVSIDFERQLHPLAKADLQVTNLFSYLLFWRKPTEEPKVDHEMQNFLDVRPSVFGTYEFGSGGGAANQTSVPDDASSVGGYVESSTLTKRQKALQLMDKKYAKLIKKLHDAESDPLRQLGPGISTYHQFLLLLFALFFVLTLLHIPVLQTFQASNFYSEGFSSMSLGNLGFSKSECVTDSMVVGSTSQLNCRAGQIAELIDYGVTTQFEDQMQCVKKPTNVCNDYIKEYSVETYFKKNCWGKTTCKITDLSSFLIMKGDGKHFQSCINPQARIFFQFKCLQTEAEIHDKLSKVQFVVMIEVLSVFLILGFVALAVHMTKYLAKEYHQNNIKPNDYTLYLKLEEAQIQEFDKKFFSRNIQDISRGAQLTKWITNQLEAMNATILQVTGKKVTIVKVDLVYDNQNMLELLIQRGQAIKSKDKAKIFQLEHLISLQKHQQYNANVSGAFITYEGSDGQRPIDHNLKTNELQIFGKKVRMKKAKDPQNYIWENMGYSLTRRLLALAASVCVMSLIIVFGFYWQFKLQRTVSIYDVYEQMNCSVFTNSFADSQVLTAQQIANPDKQYVIADYSRVRFQREAYRTWSNFYDSTSQANMARNYVNGTLSCFCEAEYQANGFMTFAKWYREDGLDQDAAMLDGFISKIGKLGKYDEVSTAQICHQYILSQQFSEWYFWIVSVLIIIYNYLFFTLTRPILSQVGFHLRTQEERLISMTVTICLIIDSIVLPLLIGASFIEYPDWKLLNKVIRGKATDFGDYWYDNVGEQLVIIMIIFALSPIIDFIAEWIELSLHRLYSKHFVYTHDLKHERNDLLKYLDLHAGPRYDFSSKFASTNFLIFFTIMFGSMLPILYPISLVGIVIQLVMDKLLLTYFYRLPPKYSEKLTIQNIMLMLFAPILGLMINYWAFGNRQMFSNALVDSIGSTHAITYSHHTLNNTNQVQYLYGHLYTLHYALVLTVVGVAAFFVHQHYTRQSKKLFEVKMLPNFYKALSTVDLEELIEDEEFFRSKGGFETISDDSLSKLKAQLAKKKYRSNARAPHFKDDVEMRLASPSSQFVNYQYTMIGSPLFADYKSVDYQLKFNNQSIKDEVNTKLLLMMPMVPLKLHEKIRLNHLKQYEIDEIEDNKLM